jgi:hypothetical protein
MQVTAPNKSKPVLNAIDDGMHTMMNVQWIWDIVNENLRRVRTEINCYKPVM